MTTQYQRRRFTPNASFYREISGPLAFIADDARRKRIVEIIDGQSSVIMDKGPTVDFVRVGLRLAECDVISNKLESASMRLEFIFLDAIEPVEELETRMTCLAWFASELHKFDPRKQLDPYTEVREVIESENPEDPYRDT